MKVLIGIPFGKVKISDLARLLPLPPLQLGLDAMLRMRHGT